MITTPDLYRRTFVRDGVTHEASVRFDAQSRFPWRWGCTCGPDMTGAPVGYVAEHAARDMVDSHAAGQDTPPPPEALYRVTFDCRGETHTAEITRDPAATYPYRAACACSRVARAWTDEQAVLSLRDAHAE